MREILNIEKERWDMTIPSIAPNDLKSSPTRIISQRSIHFSDSDSDPEDVVDRINKNRKENYERSHRPLASSSPIRSSENPIFLSRSIGDKIGERYTLRGPHYIPFKSQRKLREERRANKQLKARGGIDSMDRDINQQEKLYNKNRLNREADNHRIKLDEIEEFNEIEEPNEFLKEDRVNTRVIYDEDAYLDELEEMIRQEEEELDELLGNLSLTSDNTTSC
ncbi:hypothetical protein WICMUC_002462 [Wickerhamomyces mucosus]|uniref:Uncharacterized protein n=1 Tax=Wickerhamomyces mucosus TaxID=1378264 RepID=A0A9P8PPW5_9ASCO|nr:hypothetical protein WICMUC_002462 [Wickerhamomyces mucosus]